MWFSSWLRNRPRQAAPRKRPTYRTTLEALEDRWVPSTLTVTNNLDSGAGSLRAEIAAARSNDTIAFAPSLNGQTITLTGGELLIKKNLTIAGPGASELTLSGDNLSRVFELSGKTKPQVTLSGLTIGNGDGVFAAGSTNTNDGYGGAILNEGTLTVSNSTLSNNTANASGGGIENNKGAGTLTLTNSTLSNNTAFHLGGGIDNTNGTVSISGCTLSGNSVPGPYGLAGGIFNGVGGALTLTNSILSGNSAGSRAGGIDNQGTVTITGCTLSGNSVGRVGLGGGIYNEATLTVSNSTLSNNSAGHDGGGIYNRLGTVTISGSTLTNNSAGREGGGICNAAYSGAFTNTVTVENSSKIINNTAPAASGADVYNLSVLYLDAGSIIGVLAGNPAVPI